MFEEESFNKFLDEKGLLEKEKTYQDNIPSKAKNFSKAKLNQLKRQKTKECNAKAQRIVEALLEPVTDGYRRDDAFLSMLRDINQCHFEDVIVERAISKNCGYPLCQQLLENIPSQKYVISLSCKKVFDITERKNFCSGQCYRASNYIKNQMLTSHLWLRDQEDIPEFRLLPVPAKSMAPLELGTMADLAASGDDINTNDLERTLSMAPEGGVIATGHYLREGSEVVFKQEAKEFDGSKKDKDCELEVGMDKLSLRV